MTTRPCDTIAAHKSASRWYDQNSSPVAGLSADTPLPVAARASPSTVKGPVDMGASARHSSSTPPGTKSMAGAGTKGTCDWT